MEYSSDSDRLTRDYFDSLLLETRYLDTDRLPSTKMELYGYTFDTPIMTAALSHLGNTAENGMITYAAAAARSNAVHWVGMGPDEELEAIIATGAKTIKVVKPYADEKEIFRKIEHAVKAGCFAVSMDIDHSFNGTGGYDFVLGCNMKAKSTSQLKEYVQAASIPFIVKGVLSAEDAEKCLAAGCAGIVVSHHHGLMPFSVPPLMVLEDIVAATANEIPVFVDCGIISGMDAYKCLALGATAVSVGRHLMPILKDGPEAVSNRMNEMTAELAGIMARTGVTELSEMDSTIIHRRCF